MKVTLCYIFVYSLHAIIHAAKPCINMVSFNQNVQIVNLKYSCLLKDIQQFYKVIIFIKLAYSRLTYAGWLSFTTVGKIMFL